ncbi:MAG: hypothetical protein KAW92_13405 [Candidatus Cloacimonetes bacterium]|nr:hypothetical protein [Candidatus Cloacimonadota bacterium]
MAKEKRMSKVSLIEVLMVILFVGIIVILVFPTIADNQKKKKINEEIFPTFILIQDENEKFFEELGEYAFDISQLNIDELNDKKYFEFNLNDSTIFATTNRKFGKAGAKIVYNFITNTWSVEGMEGVVDINWLP